MPLKTATIVSKTCTSLDEMRWWVTTTLVDDAENYAEQMKILRAVEHDADTVRGDVKPRIVFHTSGRLKYFETVNPDGSLGFRSREYRDTPEG